jgi:lipooligosaccharide transport system permease protein
MLYGLSAAFGIEAKLAFILPGIIANSVAAGGFINCSFSGMERLFNKRYDSWLATTMTVPQIVYAEGLFQISKAVVVASGIWLAGVAMGVGWNPLPLLGSLPAFLLLSWTCAMLGYCVAASARDFADIELSDPLLTAAFVFSGVFVSIGTFAWPIQVFGMLLPIYHTIETVRPMFTGEIQVLPMLGHFAILLLMAAASTWLAVKLFKKRLQE